jgi:hypothetical protein
MLSQTSGPFSEPAAGDGCANAASAAVAAMPTEIPASTVLRSTFTAWLFRSVIS